MAADKTGAEAERNQSDQDDCLQPMVRHNCPGAIGIDRLGAMLTGMEESVLESRVFGEVHPAIVFLFPAIMPKPANGDRGELSFRQGRDPKPFVIGLVFLAGAVALPIAP